MTVELPTTIDVIDLSHAPYVLTLRKTGIEALVAQSINHQLLQPLFSPVSTPARDLLSASQLPDLILTVALTQSNTSGPCTSATMTLFGRNSANSTQTSPTVHPSTVAEEPHRRSRGGLFGRHRTTEPTANHSTTTTTNWHHAGLFHRNADDPSILAARERVMGAEAAERDADRALHNARIAVREARDHVKRLEREAAEE